MMKNYNFFYLILIIIIFKCSPVLSQANPNFDFNNGSIQGWSLNGPININEMPLSSSFVGPQWSDDTNYPNSYLKDPIGDANGSLSFSCGEGGTGIEDSTTFWIMQIVSPDLSSSLDWQAAKGYSVQLFDYLSQPDYSTIYANLYVQVLDNDAGSIRYFYNGTAQSLSWNEWNYFSFDWSTTGTFPKNYTVQNVFIDIWGVIGNYYYGTLYLDEVNLIPGGKITVTSPNGGENWYAGNNYDILWNAIGVATVKLEFSTNDGENWNSIATNVKADQGQYRWNIPNTPSNSCLVRVSDEDIESGVYDISNAVFSIIPPSTITVIAPNGGENWAGGSQNYISWSSTNVSNIMIEYSTDQGQNWQTVVSGIPANDETFLWTVPNTPSTNCLVKISDVANALNFDISNGLFTISPKASITLNSPNGGENFITGSTHEITWLSSPSISLVKIEYTTDGGANWIPIINNAPAGTGNYSWVIPNTPSTSCLVRITDALNISTYDLSDAFFTISPRPSVTVTTPNGGENWLVGNSYNITWTSTSVTNLKIEFSANNGINWNNVISNVPASTGSYSWTIPDLPSEQCLVKISDVSNPNVYDISNSVFTISLLQTITITSPNGGENWLIGSSYDITWISNNVTNVKIEYSTNNGSNWANIIQSTSNSGTFSWIVPNTPSTNCLVKVSDATNATINDQSNNVFTISPIQPVPTISVTSPNGGENWVVGTTHNIIWSSSSVSNVKIEYSTNSGRNWSTIISSIPSSDSQIYSWLIPNTPGTLCLVRISDASNPQTFDESNNPFTINATIPQLEVTSPKGGDIWIVGNSYNITWTSIDIANVKIEYTTNAGNTWTDIIASTTASAGIFNWNVPNTPSPNCKIRVSEAVNADVFAESDNFSINLPPPVVTFSVNMSYVSPIITSNDIVALRGSLPPLSWDQNFNLLKSDGSNIYTNSIEFESSYNNNDLLYKFVIQRSDGSLIWESNVGPGDQGNRVYNLQSGENILPTVYFNNLSLLVTSPKGGETLLSGTTYNITWESESISNLKIEYSTDGGFNWITIISSTPANTKNYGWTVPYTPSSKCLIRLSDVSNPTINDQSDSAFTIKVSEPLIAVISPKSEDKWIVGNSYTIQWNQNIQEIINIELFKGNERSIVIAAPVYAVNAPYGTYDWTIPLELPGGTDYRVKIISSINDSVFAFSEFFSIIHPAPISNFEASQIRGLRPLTVNFSDLSTGEVTNWLWNFGDGSTSNEQNPIHIYNISGAYTVGLSVTGSGGSNSITKENYILVDSLKWNLPSNTSIGENVFISTIVPDYFKPTIHKLFYRMGGQLTFIETNFQIYNDSLDAVIPQDFNTIRGIEYYILLSDGEKTYTFPETDPQNHPAIISVSLQNVTPVVTFQSKKYEMISIPLNLVNNDVINFLINAYGEYDKNNWRLFRWDNNSSSYFEYPDLNVELTPGVAFWLITRNGNSFNLFNAKSISTSKPFMINLNPGWNQIGNPFPFPIAWDSVGMAMPLGLIKVQNSDLPLTPIAWNAETEEYVPNQTTLVPWKGYWVDNTSETPVSLSIPSVESTGLMKKNTFSDITNNEFVIQIKAYDNDKTQDIQNYVGMLNNAKDGTDKFDVAEPPAISDKLNLTIIRDNKEFIQNIVAVSSEGAFWDLKINSNESEKNAMVEFEKKSSLPNDFKIWFLDLKRMLSIPVGDNGIEIQIPEDGNGLYRLIIGKEEYAKQNSEKIPLVPLDYTLFQNYPNPFNSTTNIMYNLREKSQVTIEVFDILGRRVNVLANNKSQNPGTHKILWNGKNTNGNYISSGVYVYRIRANDFSDSKMMVLLK